MLVRLGFDLFVALGGPAMHVNNVGLFICHPIGGFVSLSRSTIHRKFVDFIATSGGNGLFAPLGERWKGANSGGTFLCPLRVEAVSRQTVGCWTI